MYYTVFFYNVGGSRGPFRDLETAKEVGRKVHFEHRIEDQNGRVVYAWSPIGGGRNIIHAEEGIPCTVDRSISSSTARA